MKVRLIKLLIGNIKLSKAIYDEDKGLAKEYWGIPYFSFLRKFLHNFEVEPKHLKYDAKGKAWILIDVNARKSVDLPIKGELDIAKMNRLDYLTESAFWDSLNLKRRDIIEMLITMGCGIGIYSILRLVLGMYGFYLP